MLVIMRLAGHQPRSGHWRCCRRPRRSYRRPCRGRRRSRRDRRRRHRPHRQPRCHPRRTHRMRFEHGLQPGRRYAGKWRLRFDSSLVGCFHRRDHGYTAASVFRLDHGLLSRRWLPAGQWDRRRQAALVEPRNRAARNHARRAYGRDTEHRLQSRRSQPAGQWQCGRDHPSLGRGNGYTPAHAYRAHRQCPERGLQLHWRHVGQRQRGRRPYVSGTRRQVRTSGHSPDTQGP